MRYDITRETPRSAPYETGVTYKANGAPVYVPTCRWCGGELIGREIQRGLCGKDDRRVG